MDNHHRVLYNNEIIETRRGQ